MTRERVDALIARVMAEHRGMSAAAQLRYYEAVHQELAPLARELEADNARLLEEIDGMRRQLQARWREAADARPKFRTVYSCPDKGCGNVYRAGDQEVTVFANWGGVYCRKCNPAANPWGKRSPMRESREVWER